MTGDPEHSARKRVLLVGWDAADWKIIKPLMERGEMPFLENLVNEGTMGNLATLEPILSPMLWNSIGSGKYADAHGILGFTTVDETSLKIRPFGSNDRRCKAVWNILSQEGYRCHVINWFAGHPAEPLTGSCVTELYSREMMQGAEAGKALPPGTVFPDRLSEVMTDLRVGAKEIDSDMIHLFVPDFLEIDQEKDQRLATLAHLLAECFTVHAATTYLLEHEEWDFLASYYGSIDHFCHAFMAFHPPRADHINEKEFELYKEVINGAYRLHDLLLGRLLQLIADQTTVIVCSDHGYHSDHLRPKTLVKTPAAPAEEHRPIGILAMRGPGIKKDELVHGANLLDLTPTILAVCGLPQGKDMPGRALLDAFDDPTRIEPIPSWEDRDGPNDPCLPDPDWQMEPGETEALIEQFADLGYIDPNIGGGNDEAAIAVTESEKTWNLARVYASSGRLSKALPLFEDLYERYPLRLDFGLALGYCQLRLQLFEEGREVVYGLAAAFPGHPQARLLLGALELRRGDRQAALENLLAARDAHVRSPELFNHLGGAYLRLNQIDEAFEAFGTALGLDPDNGPALIGQTRCLLRVRRLEEAADSALQALDLHFVSPLAHYLLGLATMRLGVEDRAIQAFETCVRFAPRHAAAHRFLARLYRGREGEPEAVEKAAHHRELAGRIGEFRRQARERVERMRREAAERARERDDAYEEEEADLNEVVAEAEASLAARTPGESIRAPASRPEPGSSGKEFLIVSGLPRSGTSLMMQILDAGGIEPMTDRERRADEDNPEGYYEWEAIKQLRHSPELIEQAESKAVKVITMLLAQLPAVHRYRIVFMDRPVEEVAASQARMLERQGRPGGRTSPEKMREALDKHRRVVLERLERLPHVEVLRVDYPELIGNPREVVGSVADFVGHGDRVLDGEAMAAVVKPELYRNRSGRDSGASSAVS